MKLITGIEIKGFRSILDQKIDEMGSFTCLVGANNSGKSNVLRALSLFLSDEPEPKVDFDISRDYYKDPQRRKKREISITVDFSLPGNFRFRKGIEHLENILGRKFSICRTWRAYPEVTTITVKKQRGRKFRPLDEDTFWQFIDLIRFRYIQNRIIPSETLKQEALNFRDAVINRLRITKATETDKLMEDLNQAAADTFYEANKTITEDITSISRVVMGLAEAATLFGFSGFGAEIQTGALVNDDVLGAGSQAYMMFNLLKLIDTTYGGTFGWRQGVVWAIEEPETSLHNDLTRKLAILLRSWAEDQDLRIQVIATTHSEIITTAADRGYLVKLGDRSRTVITSKEIPELIHGAVRSGISGEIDPIMCFPTNTVVLVEGQLDSMVLEQVSQRTQIACGCKFVCLHEIDATEQRAGIDKIIDYLKKHSRFIHNRPVNSPLMILFDYDIEDDKLNKAQGFYGKNNKKRVQKMNINHADSKVSNVVRGIERFYPKDVFLSARQQNIVPVNQDQNGVLSIDKQYFTPPIKQELAKIFLNGPDNWFKHLKAVLQDIMDASLS